MNVLKPSVDTIYTAAATPRLLEALTDEFVQAMTLIGKLDDRTYTMGLEEKRSIGAHFRHNYDFVNNCLIGLRSGKLDYTRRERDPLFEENRLHAIERISVMIENLRSLPNGLLERQIQIRSEVDSTVWHLSSALREIEFLHSHTVHHHAMVAEKLKVFNIHVPDGFGVAPSTLEFWAEEKKLLNRSAV